MMRSFAATTDSKPRSAMDAFPRTPKREAEMKRSQEFKERSQPLQNQEMTFRKFRLLPEIVNVLENSMQVNTPSPI
jgi:superfamily II DNA/RNA helicase